MNWTKEQYAEYQARRSLSDTKPKSSIRNELLGKEKGERQGSGRFLIRIRSFRKKLCDTDNLCVKSMLDCCRYSGLIHDDRPEQITLEVSQEKSRDERTEIEILSMENLEAPVRVAD